MISLSSASRSSAVFGLAFGVIIGGCDGADPGGPLSSNLRLSQDHSQEAAGAPRRVWVVAQPGRKDAVRSQVRASGGSIHHDFDDLDAIAATLPSAAVDGLSRSPNVQYIEDDAQRFPLAQTVPYGIDMVQARDVWDVDRDGVVDADAPTGAGRKVCVIDSGLYTAHEDISGVAVSGYNGNLPWNQDGCGHGTHVSGTIAALNNTAGVVGVSPGATSLYIVRVFGNDCGWAYSSDLVDAAKRCQSAGGHVISMSLGGKFKSRTEERTFKQLNDAGILSVAAAGNAGNTSLSYPASYASVVSVAAIDSAEQVADFSQQNSQVDLAAPGVGVLSTVPWRSEASVTVDGASHTGTAIEFAATSSGVAGPLVDGGLCTSSGAWSGKVVLCERGDNSFHDKVVNVQNGGGLAAVIFNNASGGFSGTLGEGNSSTIPAIGISQEDGVVLLGKLGLSATVVNMSEQPASGYEAWDGTSMATPHVSAVAALVWSSNPDATNLQVREALEKSAKDLGPSGRDNAYGFGLVQAPAAVAYLAALAPPSDGGGGGGGAGGGGGGGGGETDTTAPVISAVSSAKGKGVKFEITWTTDEPSNSEVQFTCCGTYSSATLVTAHRMAFNGSQGAVYEYYVSSTDAAGNRATAGPFSHQN